MIKLNPNKLGKALAVGSAVASCINVVFLMLTAEGSESLFNTAFLQFFGIVLVSSYVLGYITAHLYNTLK